ncbi:OprO/OprP family phosphate-selective porin [bacterium]|nr:OprO/OprP family phosphate-selective porin [bacterium]
MYIQNNKLYYSFIIFLFCFLLSTSSMANGTPAPKECEMVGYDNGFYLKTCDNNYKLKFNVQLQPQYQYLGIESQDDTNTFQIRRGRLIFSGHAFSPDLTFKFQYEAIGGRDNTTRENDAFVNALRDAYIAYKFNDYINVMVGQARPYFNREELTPDNVQQFIGYTIANEVFNHARDLGVWLSGSAFDKKLEYGFYVNNEGLGSNRTNRNNDFLFGTRLVYNILGTPGLQLTAINHPEEHQLALGLAANYNTPDTNAGNNVIGTTADFIYIYKNFSFMGAGFYARDTDADSTLLGFSGQAGYFIVPKKFEVAARFAGVIPKASGITNGYEAGAGFNYYIKGHNLKIQTDYGMLINSALVHGGSVQAGSMFNGFNPGFNQDQVDHRIRTQIQLFF